MPEPILNCVVIGYHDIDFDKFSGRQKKMERKSGAYHEIKANSLLLDGQRYTFMELINQVLTRRRGVNPHLNVFEAPSLGAFYLANFLRSKGLHAEVVNFFTHNQDQLLQLLARKPHAVAITTTFYVDYLPIAEIVKVVRRYCPETKIIVGGPHIFNSALDLDAETLTLVLQQIGADIYIVDSQGESTLAQVVASLRNGATPDLSCIPNLMYDKGHGFLSTPRIPENNNLDESTINWSIFDPSVIAPVSYLRTARSCPFACSFCNYPTMAGDHVVSQIDGVELQLRYLSSIGATDVVFIDDTFNVPLPRFKKILRMMISNQFKLRWISFFRCSNADEEAFDLMKESGCVGVFLGIESGDEQILKYMNKAATLDRYKWGIRHLHQRDIATFASIICGFPGETQQSVANTLQFIEETKPTFFNVQLYYHDLRSPMQARAGEFGIQGAGYSWRHRSMDWREATQWIKYVYGKINNSGPLALYGFSLWAIPYLLSKGISLKQIRDFSYAVKPLLQRSFDDQSTDFVREKDRLATLF